MLMYAASTVCMERTQYGIAPSMARHTANLHAGL
jgi:hypothetical protein